MNSNRKILFNLVMVLLRYRKYNLAFRSILSHTRVNRLMKSKARHNRKVEKVKKKAEKIHRDLKVFTDSLLNFK